MSKLFSFLKKPIGILSIFLLIAILGFGYYFIKYNNATKNPGAEMAQKSEDTKKNTDDVVQKISKLMLVTDSSQAVLATITDKTKLSNQRFFDPAQNGDDLILLPNMQRAVLYRPSINKIIDIGPFNPNPTAPINSQNSTTTKSTGKSDVATSTKASKPVVKPSATTTNSVKK